MDDPRCALLGAPGLWKHVDSATGRNLAWDMPRWIMRDPAQPGCEEDDGRLDVDVCLGWAESCLAGTVDPAWRPPASDWIDETLPPRRRTVQRNGLVRRVTVSGAASRLALRCPVVPRADSRIEGWRVAALEQLAADAMRIWAMVRIGFEGGDGNSGMVAEVDLTGAPLNEGLFLAAFEALCEAIAAVAETGELLANPQVDLQSLSGCWFEPPTNQQTKGAQ